jgi:hypothetical protein
MAKAKNKVDNIVNIDNSVASNMSQIASQFLGQPVAILCARYNYRGILSHVGEDCVVLAQARAVETSGSASQETPTTEDPVGSSIVISMGAIEIIYQPRWCFAPLDA